MSILKCLCKSPGRSEKYIMNMLLKVINIDFETIRNELKFIKYAGTWMLNLESPIAGYSVYSKNRTTLEQTSAGKTWIVSSRFKQVFSYFEEFFELISESSHKF